MKRTIDGDWAHVSCALWIPESGFDNVTTMEPISKLDVPFFHFHFHFFTLPCFVIFKPKYFIYLLIIFSRKSLKEGGSWHVRSATRRRVLVFSAVSTVGQFASFSFSYFLFLTFFFLLSFLSWFLTMFISSSFFSTIAFHVTCAMKESLSMGIHERNGVVYNDVFCKKSVTHLSPFVFVFLLFLLSSFLHHICLSPQTTTPTTTIIIIGTLKDTKLDRWTLTLRLILTRRPWIAGGGGLTLRQENRHVLAGLVWFPLSALMLH